MKNNYQVFVASSLRLDEHRKAASDAIEKANEEVKDKDLSFSEFVYERSKINQKLEKKDAQEPADKALRESALFFLIIENKIHSLTQYEFELALENFNRGYLPQYIFIFYHKQPQKEGDADGLTYEEFVAHENLQVYLPDSQNNVVAHSRIYAIPYDSVDDLKGKMKAQLVSFADSEERPFSGALRGEKLTKDYFFADERRRERCTDLYLRREMDDELDDAIKNRKFVILSGPSLSGKTRAVMEAMRAVDDGWVYILRQDDAAAGDCCLSSEIKRLISYLGRKNYPKLYIVLDNIDTWAQKEEVQEALETLVEKIWDSNAVIVGTSSSKNLSLPGINPRENPRSALIEIEEMDEHDFAEVRDFFVSAGVQFDERNLRYRRTGALFVDLNDILGKYHGWLNKGSELMRLAKKMLLRAMKALSVWRDDYIGDRRLMLSLAKWFCEKDVECEWQDDDLEEACKRALQNLLSQKGMGVSSAGANSPVVVQEYIYRYFIDNDGSLLQDGRTSTPEGERKLVRLLMKYCKEMHDREPEFMEPLTVQVSRICRRCTFKDETVGWLYGLWAGTGEVPKTDSGLATMLRNDREKCRNSRDERMAHFYSSVIQIYIYKGCNDMAEARRAYEGCPEHMRTDHLLSALMRKAKNAEERDDIRSMADYEKMKHQAYVIAAEVEWADDYAQAKSAFTHFARNESPRGISERLLDGQRDYDIYQLRRAAGALANKVGTVDEYEDFCEVLRTYYLYLAYDTNMLKMIRDHSLQYQPGNLTLIDLLAVLQPHPLRHMVENVFGGEMDASKAFTDSIILSVEATLRGPFADETTVRLTVSLVVSLLIKRLADAPYEELYENIFAPLRMQHPLHSGKMLILRNTYTYTAMLGNNYCDIQHANNLLENDLIPHAMDAANNPLTINTYTLNVMMDKSKDEKKRLYARMINKLYDQMGKQRDAFTYSRLIAITDSMAEGLELLRRMCDEGIKPNVFVLNELMNRPYVSLVQALRFLDLSEVDYPEDFDNKAGKNDPSFDSNVVIEQLRPQMNNQQASWGNLFRKECKDENDKALLAACLTYLETRRPELLKGGYVYNNLINNDTYLPKVNDIMNFVREKVQQGLFSPDSYTAKHVIDRILNTNGHERLKAVDRLNDLLGIVMEGRNGRLDTVVVCHRIKMYRDHQETLKMAFFDGQGNVEVKEMSAAGYVETMQKFGHPVESYAIGNLLNIRSGLNDNTFNRLMETLVRQQDTYPLGPNDVKIIRERCIGYFEDYSDRIPALNTPLTAHEHNRTLVWKYGKGKMRIDLAMDSLEWSNPNSAICSFNDIMDAFINSQRLSGSVSFPQVMSFYTCYVKDKSHVPTSLTIAILAKATTCWTDMQLLLDEYDLQKKLNPRLVLESPLLSQLSSFTDTVGELKQRTAMMHAKGCAYNSKAANHYVYRLASRLLARDTASATAVLDDLLRFVVEGGDVRQLLQEDERIHLMLDMYAEPQNVTPELLRTLIYYNASHAEPQPYSHESMLECITKRYASCIIPLLERLNGDSTARKPMLPLREDVKKEEVKRLLHIMVSVYMPCLFNAIPNGSRPHLSGWLMANMAYRLPHKGLGAYVRFLKRLYEMDCREIDDAVPNLASFLSYLRNVTVKDPKMSAARKTLAQIVIYSDLNKLRNGHLLVDKAPDRYAQWCYRIMDYRTIRQQLERHLHVYESLDWSQMIMYHANRLDDAYPCSLRIYKKYADPTIQMDEDTYRCIRKQEHRYAMSIQKGDVYFSDVLKLPLLWINVKWKPSCELVLAMITSLTRVAWSPETNAAYRADALRRLALVEDAFKAAIEKKEKYVIIHYHQIGLLPSSDIHNREIPLPVMGRLLYDLYLNHLASLCINARCVTRDEAARLRTAELCCARYRVIVEDTADSIEGYIEKNEKDMELASYIDWLEHLPGRWEKLKDGKGTSWIPHANMVLSMIWHYAQLSSEKGKEASIARKIIWGVRKSMDYARKTHHSAALIYCYTLGISAEKDCRYVLVPLAKLDKLQS